MEKKEQRKSPRLAAKLKKAVQHLHVDVFGYEPKVTQNITGYFTTLSEETGIPRERLVLRIFKDRDTIQAGIHHQGRLVKKIPVATLIGIFTDVEPSGFLDMEASVTHKIKSFIKELATTRQMSEDQLQICILSSEERVWVKAYHRTEYIKDIPLRVLIKHFI